MTIHSCASPYLTEPCAQEMQVYLECIPFLPCSSTFLSNRRPEEELDVFTDGVKYSAKGPVRGESKKGSKGETEL